MSGEALAAVDPVAEVIDYKTEEAWLAARKRGVGASEAAALFSLSPWDSPFSLWAKKTGKFTELPGASSQRQRMGHRLEPLIAELYAEKHPGRKVWRPGPFVMAHHPRLACMFATPDGWIVEADDRNADGLLQIKNTSHAAAWEDGPPDHVLAQVQHEMAVSGRSWCSVAVLIEGWDFRSYDVERDETFIAELLEQVACFWRAVETDTPPDLDGHRATFEALKRMHPLDNGETVELAPSASGWWDEMGRVKSEIAALCRKKDEIEARLRDAIGPNTFGQLADGRMLSLKHTTRGAHQIEESTFRTLREVATASKRRPPKGAGRP